jgi:hypothetical protein
VLFLVHRFLSPWWRRRQVPPKRLFLQEPHGVTSQKTTFFSSTSSSGKCIGCLDAILSCHSTIKSYYTSKLYVQFGVMVSSSGAVPMILILKWFNATKTKCWSVCWLVRNSDFRRDLGIATVTDIIVKFTNSNEKGLQNHINIEASRLVNVNNITRWLKRKKPFELVRR